VLASVRVAKRPYALAAGAAIALGLVTKATFGLYVVGFLVVVLLRGGWRNPVGLLCCAAVPATLGLPWYVNHFDEVHNSLRTALHGTVGGAAPSSYHRDVWNFKNFGWYGWAMVNVQLLMPLTLLFGVGLIESTLRFVRRPRRDDYLPELIAGGVVGYVLVSVGLFHDARYTLPALVYVAVIGTAWIVRSPRPVRLAATGALLAAFATNTAMVNLHLGSPVRIAFPYSIERGVRERQLTFVSSEGFVVNKPLRGQRVLELLRAARADGARRVYFDGPSTKSPLFRGGGLGLYARLVGLGGAPDNDPKKLGPKDIVMLRHPPVPGQPPCTRLADGSGVYLARGYPRADFDHQKHYCPPGFGAAS
jgi:hypothetical protein